MNMELTAEEAQYDFNGLIRARYEKLTDKGILTILWDQLTNKEPVNSHEDKLTEYRSHLPTDLYKYLKLLELKYSEIPKENLQLINGVYKSYFLTFIYFCTKKEGTVTDKAKVTASSLYLNLTMLPEIGKLFFNKALYKRQMYGSVEIIKSHDITVELKESFIKHVKRHCLQEEHLDNEMLAASANVIVVSMAFGASEEMIKSGKEAGLTACCMKALRIILLHTSNHTLVKIITQRLFRCIRKHYLDFFHEPKLAVDIVILFIKGTLKIRGFDRKIQPILDGFVNHWKSEDFENYKDAVKIMNGFGEEHYKELLRKMITLTEPTIRKEILLNIFNLARQILVTPPEFPLDKISVLYSCVVCNISHHILNSDEQVAAVAIDVLTEICDATTNPLHRYLFAEVRATRKLVKIPVDSLLLALCRVTTDTWSPRNKNLLHIFVRFVAVTPRLNPLTAEKVIEDILRDANPSSFDYSLEILQIGFLTTSERNDIQMAEIFLQVIHKFASLTTDKYHMKYAKNIFYGMLNPSVVEGRTYSPKCYYNVYLTSNFDFEGLFMKCNNYISEKEITLAITNLDYKEHCSAVLICCLLEHCHYRSINLLAPYIIENFSDLSGYLTSGYISIAFEKILKNQTVSDLDHPQLDAIQSSIMAGLFDRSFPVQSIKPVFSLYKVIRRILRLTDDDAQLDELLNYTARKVLNKLHATNFENDNSVLYLSELCLLLNKIPNDAILVMLEKCLDNTSRISILMTRMPDIYIQTLTLLCTIASVKKSKVALPLKYLHQNLYSGDIIIKVLTIKLLYSLCREITHEFEVVIEFAFKQMVAGTLCLIRICAGIIEELIHEDYIKLTSENFFRLVYGVGCKDLKVFIKEVLLKRFVLSNQNDITQYYMQTVMYTNMYGKFSSYPISNEFYGELDRITKKMNAPGEVLEFLFVQLPISKKINIMTEISSIIEALLKGQCKVDDNFFDVLLHLIATVKLMKTPQNKSTSKRYYLNIIKQVEKQIIGLDPNFKREQYYKEYENEIKRITLALLKLLFFENQQIASKIQPQLFDALINWIDFIKGEIIYYIHEERGKEYDPYFAKLVQFYKKNKNMFDNFSRGFCDSNAKVF